MIKLRTIVNEVLLKEEEQITWGEVSNLFAKLKKRQTTGEAVNVFGKIGLSLLGIDAIDAALEFIGDGQDLADTAKAFLSLGKSYSNQTLKEPKGSELKKLTGPFWKAIKLSPEVSQMLDDKIEAQFINQVLLPKLNQPGSANEPLPNMDELLGKWLNDNGLVAKTNIQFKGKQGDL